MFHSQVMFITIMMCVMDFLTPFGYRARARDSDDEPGNEFNLLNSLWFATASILQQGPDNTPLAPSGRLLASTFWFFILILISTYTANLAAFFTSKSKRLNSQETHFEFPHRYFSFLQWSSFIMATIIFSWDWIPEISDTGKWTENRILRTEFMRYRIYRNL